MPISTENVGLAFGAVFAAGASTCLGASVVFFPKLVKLTSKNFLASSLGISAGVMTYVSFVEIFQKSQHAFIAHLEDMVQDEDKRWGRANCFATISFFSGVVIMILIDYIIKLVVGDHHHHHHHHHDHISSKDLEQEEKDDSSDDDDEEVVVPPCACSSPDPAGDLEQWHQRAKEEEEGRKILYDDPTTTLVSKESADQQSSMFDCGSSHGSHEDLNKVFRLHDVVEDEEDQCIENVEEVKAKEEKHLEEMERKKLGHMGVTTAVAIALHNFPEGLATFVAVLQDPEIGAVLAVAIAIHNIPEGFCVALPIYYSTGDRLKAFFWGSLSGMTEPIGALFGWLILAKFFSEAIYGVMYGAVAGMMVMISLKELLPTAYRYDPHDKVVTRSLIGGMVVISLSLVLFYI
jgi:ZIP family zinc transporter